MTFWQWFQSNGDRVFAFFSLLSVALKGVDGVPANISQTVMIVGIVATVAHQAFFPNVPGLTGPKA